MLAFRTWQFLSPAYAEFLPMSIDSFMVQPSLLSNSFDWFQVGRLYAQAGERLRPDMFQRVCLAQCYGLASYTLNLYENLAST